ARDGDAAIAELAAALARPGRAPADRVLVVTADRGLRERVRAAGADVTGPGALLDALPEP
ncbi:MAG TPA: ADP-ribose pyrophosphatase, partial [Pseudonocardia sp.]